jgi:hypothetical protein
MRVRTRIARRHDSSRQAVTGTRVALVIAVVSATIAAAWATIGAVRATVAAETVEAVETASATNAFPVLQVPTTGVRLAELAAA